MCSVLCLILADEVALQFGRDCPVILFVGIGHSTEYAVLTACWEWANRTLFALSLTKIAMPLRLLSIVVRTQQTVIGL